MMNRLSMATGLALLYASAYYLFFLNPISLYFVPSFFRYVVYPSLITVLILTPIFFLVSGTLLNPTLKRSLIFFGSGFLTIVAIKSIFDAANYPWVKIFPLVMGSDIEFSDSFRFVKYFSAGALYLAIFGFLFIFRKNLKKWVHWLSVLGYAFVFLAIYRCIAFDLIFEPAKAPVSDNSYNVSPEVARRVVWVIFDEMDYGLSLGQDSGLSTAMPNFSALAEHAVTASNAFSPGRDTTYSIPALLTGTPLSGVSIDFQNKLDLIDQRQEKVRFATETAIFGKLPGGAQSATVLGFYHPYCKIFQTLQKCNSTYMGNAGRWFDSLTFFSTTLISVLRNIKGIAQLSPEFVLYNFDLMYRISKDVLSQLDKTIANQHSSLDFIHVNMPHLPNVYAQRLLNQSVTNDTDAYRQNLSGADMVLGNIVKDLKKVTPKQDILLIVSSDHWLRTHSKQPAPIPFIIWRVGENAPISLPGRVSTVHSKQIALDFLSGNLNTQLELADALQRTNYYETWSAPDGYKY